MNPGEWLRYKNQGAIRNKPISDRLAGALSFLPELGLEMEVFSGGQAAQGTGGPRTGSTRHDHGESADVFLYKDGRRLDWANAQDRPMFEQVVARAKTNGVTGFGAGPGYMQPGSMHIGFGTPSVWGAGGSSANAPDWLQAAYNGAPAGSNSAQVGGDTLIGSQGTDTMAATQTVRRPPLSILEEPTMPEERRLLGGLLSEDKRDRLIMGLEGMTMNPNRGLMLAASEGIQGRAKSREEAQQQAKDAQRKNATAEWLASQGREDLAQAMSTGGLSAADAIKLALTPTQEKRLTPYSDAAKLQADLQAGYISPQQYESGMSSLGQSGESAPEASIRRIMDAYDVDRRTATGIVDGTLRVSRDPVDDTVIVTDLATRESYRPGMPDDTAQPTLEAPQQDRQKLSFPGSSGSDASEAFGLEGMLKGGANAASDFVGMDAPFEGVRETQSDFAVLSESLINDVASAYERQPPSWLLENIRELTPHAGGFQGAGTARSRLGALRRNFENELNIANEQLGRRMSPTERQSLLSRKTGLEAAIAKVDSYVGRFGEGESNKTQSGVSWSVVE